MEVVLTARNCEVTDRYRAHVTEKLTRLEKHDHRLMRVHVEVDCAPNPRQHKGAVRVELTAYSRGPVIRAEACAEDKMAALDGALDKMVAQMRRAADRRRVHRGRQQQAERSFATAVPESPAAAGATAAVLAPVAEQTGHERKTGSLDVIGEGPLVVREKVHQASPLTLDQALYEMELVGHDFFLFVDKESARPAVVYRRRGYDYGVIEIDLVED